MCCILSPCECEKGERKEMISRDEIMSETNKEEGSGTTIHYLLL